jgi:hypothetical protein
VRYPQLAFVSVRWMLSRALAVHAAGPLLCVACGLIWSIRLGSPAMQGDSVVGQSDRPR